MSRSYRRDSLRKRAPRCCRIGKSSRRVRGGSGALGDFHLRAWLGDDRSALRIAESTLQPGLSQPTFDNTFSRLDPHGKPIRPDLRPAFGNRSEASLLTLALEAEPSVAVLARDLHTSPERVLTPLRGTTSFGKALKIYDPFASCRSPVSLSSFRGQWRHQPDLPPSAPRVEKGPITHSRFLPRRFRAKACADELFVFAGRVPRPPYFGPRCDKFFCANVCI
jgi:hypothetical protein